MLIAITHSYPAIPATVSGALRVTSPDCLSSSQLPPNACAPTRSVAAATSAPVASASASTKAAPRSSAPVLQLHSRTSPLRLRARPMAARSAWYSFMFSRLRAPAPKLTSPARPWATMWIASISSRPCTARAICGTACSALASSTACTSGRSPAMRVLRSLMLRSIKTISLVFDMVFSPGVDVDCCLLALTDFMIELLRGWFGAKAR